MSFRRTVALWIIVFLGLLLLIRLFLPLYPYLLYKNDAVIPRCDIVVPLSGSINTRLPEAARIYKAGGVGAIVLTRTAQYYPQYDSYLDTESEAAIKILQKSYGVTPSALVDRQEQPVMSTYDEAVAVRDYCLAYQIQSILVVTSDFHSRRAYLVFRAILPADIAVYIRAVPNRVVTRHNWWKKEYGIQNYLMEPLKLLNFYFNRDNQLVPMAAY